jgi:hypothetical protein
MTPNASAAKPVVPVNAGMAGGAKKAKAPSVKKHLCGRDRVVVKEGRSSYVVIGGVKHTMTEAKKLDAEWRAAQKAKAAAKKAKAAAKKTKKTA